MCKFRSSNIAELNFAAKAALWQLLRTNWMYSHFTQTFLHGGCKTYNETCENVAIGLQMELKNSSRYCEGIRPK